MQITLVSPFQDIRNYGLRMLSACLKREGHGVRCVFLPRDFWIPYPERTVSDLVEIARGSDLLGFSLMTNYFDQVVYLTQIIKRELNLPIIWGGIHPTIRPEECLEFADMICIGEGENTMAELAKSFDENRSFLEMPGIRYKGNSSIGSPSVLPLIQNLDLLPFPDYEWKDQYILPYDTERIEPVSLEKLAYFMNGVYRTQASRGCPYACAYCCNNFFRQMYPTWHLVRRRSPQHIIQELIDIKQNMPFINKIVFNDDAFMTYSSDEIKEISILYKKHIHLPLHVNGITPTTINSEKLELLIDAGLSEIRMGIQFASQRIIDMYKRPCSNTKITQGIDIIEKYRSKLREIRYDIILDNPWVEEDDHIETLRFLAKIPTPYVYNLFSLSFYPGTGMYSKAKAEGLIKEERSDIYRKYLYDIKPSYWNGLYFILQECATRNIRVSPLQMFMLTNPIFVRLKISWFVYAWLFRKRKVPRVIQDLQPLPKWFLECAHFPSWAKRLCGV